MSYEGKVNFNIDKMRRAASKLSAAGADVPNSCPSVPNMPNPHGGAASKAVATVAAKCAGIGALLGEMASILKKRATYAEDGRVWASTAPTAAIAKHQREIGRKLGQGWADMSDEERAAALRRASSDPDIAAGLARSVGTPGLLEAARNHPNLVGQVVGMASRPDGATGRGAFTEWELGILLAEIRSGWVLPAGPTPVMMRYDSEAFYEGLVSGAGLAGRQPLEIGIRPSALTRALIDEAAAGYYDSESSPKAFRQALDGALARAAKTVHASLLDSTETDTDGVDAEGLRRALGLLIGSTENVGDLDVLRNLGQYQAQAEQHAQGASVETFRDKYLDGYVRIEEAINASVETWKKEQLEHGRMSEAALTNTGMGVGLALATAVVSVVDPFAGVAVAGGAAAAQGNLTDDGALTPAQLAVLDQLREEGGARELELKIRNAESLLNQISKSGESWKLPPEVDRAFEQTSWGWQLRPNLLNSDIKEAIDALAHTHPSPS